MGRYFSHRAISFFEQLSVPPILPKGISVMNPYESGEVQNCLRLFFRKYFNDDQKRVFLVGINPGRFGGGLTGIAFTDPINMESQCGIINPFDKKPELSSRFIYSMIGEYGGVLKFFSRFYLTALYPLALIKDNKNYNYYDSRELWLNLKKEVITLFELQLKIGARKDSVICLGKKNEKYLTEINDELGYFKKVITLDHPRYIMQYKFKEVNKYVNKYLAALNEATKE